MYDTIYILYYFVYINFFCYRLYLVIVLIGCRVYLSKKKHLCYNLTIATCFMC